MTLYDAIYTRQSVDRADSISVESQVEFCKKEVVEREFRVYTDEAVIIGLKTLRLKKC